MKFPIIFVNLGQKLMKNWRIEKSKIIILSIIMELMEGKMK